MANKSKSDAHRGGRKEYRYDGVWEGGGREYTFLHFRQKAVLSANRRAGR